MKESTILRSALEHIKQADEAVEQVIAETVQRAADMIEACPARTEHGLTEDAKPSTVMNAAAASLYDHRDTITAVVQPEAIATARHALQRAAVTADRAEKANAEATAAAKKKATRSKKGDDKPADDARNDTPPKDPDGQ